jgi:hypothetical protein
MGVKSTLQTVVSRRGYADLRILDFFLGALVYVSERGERKKPRQATIHCLSLARMCRLANFE